MEWLAHLNICGFEDLATYLLQEERNYGHPGD